MDNMDKIGEEELSQLLRRNIYSPEQHHNLMLVQNFNTVAEWTVLCSKQCLRDPNDPELSVREKECYNRCGFNMFNSYLTCLKTFAQQNKYKRYD